MVNRFYRLVIVLGMGCFLPCSSLLFAQCVPLGERVQVVKNLESRVDPTEGNWAPGLGLYLTHQPQNRDERLALLTRYHQQLVPGHQSSLIEYLGSSRTTDNRAFDLGMIQGFYYFFMLAEAYLGHDDLCFRVREQILDSRLEQRLTITQVHQRLFASEASTLLDFFWRSYPRLRLTLRDVQFNDETVSIVVRSASAPPPLPIPILVTSELSECLYGTTITNLGRITLPCSGRIRSVQVDPDYKVLRLLTVKETPSVFGGYWSSSTPQVLLLGRWAKNKELRRWISAEFPQLEILRKPRPLAPSMIIADTWTEPSIRSLMHYWTGPKATSQTRAVAPRFIKSAFRSNIIIRSERLTEVKELVTRTRQESQTSMISNDQSLTIQPEDFSLRWQR